MSLLHPFLQLKYPRHKVKENHKKEKIKIKIAPEKFCSIHFSPFWGTVNNFPYFLPLAMQVTFLKT